MDTAPFVAAGYFLAKQATLGAGYATDGLLPDPFTTLSGCLADFAFEFWWNHDGVAAAERFGVPTARHPELIDWYTSRFDRDFGAPNVAFSVAVIDEFLAEFSVDSTGLSILGCGQSREAAELLMGTRRVSGELGEYGVMEMLERGEPLAAGGESLGFEPLSYEYGLECSWVCNSLPEAVADELSIRPDPSTGLLSSLGEAEQAVAYIDRDDVGAEPGTWLPWLIVRYPLDPATRHVGAP